MSEDKKIAKKPKMAASKQPNNAVTNAEGPVASYSVGRQRSKARKVLAVVILVAVILIALVALLLKGVTISDNGLTQISQHEELENDGNRNITSEEEDIAGVVESVSPSVVSITASSQTESPYFGPQEQEGAGTGVIVSRDGYIMTNKHVIEDASEVGVVTNDGASYDNVRVVGTDPLNDIAFLKIDGVNDLKAAELGDSTSVRVGQKVIAIGNSLGQYQNTVTSGIISGTGRPISAQSGNSVETLTDLLQTDAAINPGNSGGPLLNLSGQVIGINTAIIEDAQGIGFSIPINSTKGVLKGVLADDKVERAYLGVSYIPITAEAADFYDLPVKQGAYVYRSEGENAVMADGPADKAGIENGDIITKVSNVEIGDRGGMASLIGEYAPGETIQLTVLRDGREMTMNITLEAYSS